MLVIVETALVVNYEAWVRSEAYLRYQAAVLNRLVLAHCALDRDSLRVHDDDALAMRMSHAKGCIP